MSDAHDFIQHVPCPKCGSQDNAALYGDGHTYCFGCHVYTKDGVELEEAVQIRGDFLLQRIKALESRCLSRETCARYGYGVAKLGDEWVHVAPYHSPAGRLVAQKLRTVNKEFPWLGDSSAAGFFGQARVTGDRRLVITEGEIDAMSIYEATHFDAVSLKNGASSVESSFKSNLEWLETFKEVVLVFDNDVPGKEAAQAGAAILSPGKTRIATLPLKDANEMLKAGRGGELKGIIYGAKLFSPGGLITGDEAWEFFTKPSPPAIKYGWYELDEMTEGHRDGCIITLAAGTSAGKSTFCQQQIVKMVDAGVKVGYVGVEENTKKQIESLCSVAMEKPLRFEKTEFNIDEVKAVFDKRFRDSVVFYNHQGDLNSTIMLNKMRWMIKGFGCRRIILDHLSIVVAGEGKERTAIDDFMKRLRGLVEETDATVFLVCHLSRPDKKGIPFEEGRRPRLMDLRGSSMIEGLSDDVFGFQRNQMDEDPRERNTVTVWVLKCRHTNELGQADRLYYDKSRCLLVPEFSFTNG